jgi:hypothetical protein
MKNKRGFGGILLFVSVLLILMIIAFITSIGIGIIDYASDEITPIMKDFGVVGEANVSEAAEYSFGVVDSFVQALPWLTGFLLVLSLIFSVIFAVSISNGVSPAFIGVYLALVILLIFGGVILSNMYEDIYTGNDEISIRLQEQTINSFLILHSPWVITIISLFTGIYLFTRSDNEIGGYNV